MCSLDLVIMFFSFFLRFGDSLEARECVLREWSGGLASTKGERGILGAVFSISGRLGGGFLKSGMPGSVMRHLGTTAAAVAATYIYD